MDQNKILEQLARKCGTDKLDHGYIPFYESTLPDRSAPISLLEIGVKEGNSIRMWLEYFPNATIHGLDLFIEHRIPFQDPRVKWHSGSQCNWLMLEELRKFDFDVIIDDGSHNSRDQMITFFGLFNGKQYYIEDLQCCYEDFYRQGLPHAATARELFGMDFLGDLETIHNGKIVLIKC